MDSFTGNCLCGSISYQSSSKPKLMMNCHCMDCRKASGGPYLANVFIDEKSFKVQGNPKSFKHTSDKGSTMTKYFCENCGSQVFGKNSARPGSVTIRGGTINETDVIQPSINLFVNSKIPSTPINKDLKTFSKMPN